MLGSAYDLTAGGRELHLLYSGRIERCLRKHNHFHNTVQCRCLIPELLQETSQLTMHRSSHEFPKDEREEGKRTISPMQMG